MAGLCTVFFTQTYSSNSRADPTSFTCLLPDNQTNNINTVRKDRVIANSDGALIIKTNKKDGGAGRLIWDKQKTAIAFEVTSSLSKNMIDKKAKKISHEFLTAIKSQEQNIPKAMANTRAAQMYAEMLGIVCHPEYYQQGEQTVNIFKICGGGLICRLLLSTLLVSKLPFTGPPSHPISSVPSIPEESRDCQKQWTLNTLSHAISLILNPVQLSLSILLHSFDMLRMDGQMLDNSADLAQLFIVS